MDEQTYAEQRSASAYADKLEQVFRAYEKSLDLDIALTIVPLSEADRIKLVDDPDLAARIMLCDAKVREELISDVRIISKTSISDSVRLSALKELGRTIYPKRFKDTPQEATVPVNVIRYQLVEATE